MKFRKFKSLTVLLSVLGTGAAWSDVTRIEVIYVDHFEFLNPLVDQGGTPLTAGGEANDDGAVVQLGYFDQVPHLLDPADFGVQHWDRFTPLTGAGSPNAERHPTSIGGYDSRASGPFGFLFYPAPVAIELDTELDRGLPESYPVRLGIRFFDGTTVEESTTYNIVTSDYASWILPDPAAGGGENVVLNLDEVNLTWASGVGGAYQTAMVVVPEPVVMAQLLLGALFLTAVRRRRARERP